MTNVQRIIKYCALAFAFFLIFTIGSGIFYGITSLGMLFEDIDFYESKEEYDDEDERENNREMRTFSIDEMFDSIYINSGVAALTISVGDEFKLETDSKYIKASVNSGKLKITDNRTGFRFFNGESYKSKVNLVLPVGTIYRVFDIESGVGNVNIGKITAEKVILDLGVGNVSIDNIEATRSLEIEGGVGEVNIKEGKINNLDVSLGAGKCSITSYLDGDTEIETGVGEFNLTVYGNINDYRIHTDKGIGSILIDGESFGDNSTIGNGRNKLDIEGGVGSINIKFIDLSQRNYGDE